MARPDPEAAGRRRARRYRQAARLLGAAALQDHPHGAVPVPAARPVEPLRFAQPGPGRQRGGDDAGGAYPFSTGQPNYREFFYSTVGLSGESQGFDGNGPFVRFQAGGGPNLSTLPSPATDPPQQSVWGQHLYPLGTRPRLPTQGKPPFRMDVPCYTQTVPDLNGPAGAIGPASPQAP